ncbi:O-antigen ligase family protein [Pseudokineococcus sp. 1T1Z-3]|uniref:O-antigen ligase family protein n=1 Tax=Pseudokineococcus sp. 1T1Z-3 TaxID=3132745 RepID=UPI0030A4EB99
MRAPVVDRRRRTPADAVTSWWARWWVATCGVALVLASDYDWRTRPPGEATGGALDLAVLVEIAVYGAVGAYLVLVHADPPRIVRLPLQLGLLLGYAGLVVLSVSYTPYVLYAGVRAVQMLVLVGLGLALATRASTAHAHRFAHAFLVLVALSTVYGVLVPSPPANRLQEGRFTWLAIHPTVSGVLSGLAVVVAVAYLSAGRRPRGGPQWPIPVYALLLLVVGGALLGTQTRGAVLGALAAGVVVTVSLQTGRALVDWLLAAVVLGSGLLLAGSAVAADYLARGEDASQLATLNSRTMLWEVALAAVREQPLWGYGTTASRMIFYEETGLGGGHNAVVNVLVELGVVGLLVWAALVVVLVLRVRALPRAAGRGLSVDRSVVLGVVAFLMVDGVVYEGAGAVANVAITWLVLCVGWSVAAEREARTGTPAAAGDRPWPTPSRSARG